jgi:hypothetical protein
LIVLTKDNILYPFVGVTLNVLDTLNYFKFLVKTHIVIVEVVL